LVSATESSIKNRIEALGDCKPLPRWNNPQSLRFNIAHIPQWKNSFKIFLIRVVIRINTKIQSAVPCHIFHPRKISRKFVDNCFSYPVYRQTQKRQNPKLLGRGRLIIRKFIYITGENMKLRLSPALWLLQLSFLVITTHSRVSLLSSLVLSKGFLQSISQSAYRSITQLSLTY